MQAQKSERFFSIELNSKNQIKTLSMTGDGQSESVLIEGSIGTLVDATFTEGVILEVVGSKGTIRLDLRFVEIRVNVKQ